MISIQEAINIILNDPLELNTRESDIYQSYRYHLARDVRSDRDYPPFDRAAVDGLAVSSKDLENGIREFPIEKIIYSGEKPVWKFKEKSAIHIMTGAPVPEGYDVLFKIEECDIRENHFHFNSIHYKTGMNISRKGENSKEGAVIVEKGTILDHLSVHSLAAVGMANPEVFEPPSVSIISTGNEVIPLDQKPQSYQIRNSNYPGLLFFLKKHNIENVRHFLVRDSKREIKEAVQKGLESNLLLLTGGVSMGEADFVPEILEKLGVKKEFHKVNIKPGKPLWYGRHEKTRVFGLPGNPLSTLVSFKIFIEPLILKSFYGTGTKSYYLPLGEERILKGDRPEFYPVKIVFKNGQSHIFPLSFKGSGDITATLGSDGLAFHPTEAKKLPAGTFVEFIPWL